MIAQCLLPCAGKEYGCGQAASGAASHPDQVADADAWLGEGLEPVRFDDSPALRQRSPHDTDGPDRCHTELTRPKSGQEIVSKRGSFWEVATTYQAVKQSAAARGVTSGLTSPLRAAAAAGAGLASTITTGTCTITARPLLERSSPLALVGLASGE